MSDKISSYTHLRKGAVKSKAYTDAQDAEIAEAASAALEEVATAASNAQSTADKKLDATAAAVSAAKLTTARTLSITGDVSGSASFDGSANASIAATLASSGATAGSYGPTANVSPAFGGTFAVPQVTVDAKGRVTSAAARTITVPAAPTTVTGNAGSATKLATARTIQTDLASTSAASFDGSANVTPGVTGTLPIANGGTGNTSGLAASATKLATSRTIRTNLASTTTASFDGSADITPGVTGTLPIANGGTGNTTGLAASATKLATSRTVSLTGEVTGSGTFDGSANLSIAATVTKQTATSASLPTSGWSASSNSDYPYYYDITVSSVTAKDVAMVIIAPASLSAASDCGLCPTCETLTGKIRVYSAAAPAAAIVVQYWVEKGA